MKNYLTILGIALTLALPHAAQAQGVTPPAVPTDIEVEAPNEAFLLGRGIGTQNYECQPVKSLGRVDWVLFTPQATLFGDGDEQLITPFFSPNPIENGIVRVAWQDSRDTSINWGQPRSNQSGPHARSKKRIVAGAIAGGLGGFFAGGFLGAHIEGDRCDCDDPGVRGFLIGAPIGAAAGGILGATFLF